MSRAKKAIIAGVVIFVFLAVGITVGVLCAMYFNTYGKMVGNIYVSDQEARLLFGEDSLFLSEEFIKEYGLEQGNNHDGELLYYVEFDAYHYDRYKSYKDGNPPDEPNKYDEKAYKYNGYYVSDAVKNGLSGVRLDYYKKGESDLIESADKTLGELKYSEDINEGSVVLNVVKDKHCLTFCLYFDEGTTQDTMQAVAQVALQNIVGGKAS